MVERMFCAPRLASRPCSCQVPLGFSSACARRSCHGATVVSGGSPACTAACALCIPCYACTAACPLHPTSCRRSQTLATFRADPVELVEGQWRRVPLHFATETDPSKAPKWRCERGTNKCENYFRHHHHCLSGGNNSVNHAKRVFATFNLRYGARGRVGGWGGAGGLLIHLM